MSHGHVTPREDGKKASCGGPWHCRSCRVELVEYRLKLAREGQAHGVKLHAAMVDALSDPRFAVSLWERIETEIATMQEQINTLTAERDDALAAKKGKKAAA